MTNLISSSRIAYVSRLISAGSTPRLIIFKDNSVELALFNKKRNNIRQTKDHLYCYDYCENSRISRISVTGEYMTLLYMDDE